MEPFIFTEAFNCGKIAGVSVQSFVAHHPGIPVFVFGTRKDFEEMGPVSNFAGVQLIDSTNDTHVQKLYYHGHDGTAHIFAQVMTGSIKEFDCFIHFDSDTIFKRECISQALIWFTEYDIFGSRRCYVNNPANIPVDPSLPDTISTYFFGMKKSIIPNYPFDYLAKMCKGSVNPLGHSVFDFFDPVTFVCIKNGARIKFVDSDWIGGQNEKGSKVNKYKSNMHLDMGSHVAHFGGVGTGYSFMSALSNPPLSYAQWALGRYALFSKIFYSDGLESHQLPACKYGDDGRWVNGTYDETVLTQVLSDLTS